jgi:hypothetical protein
METLADAQTKNQLLREEALSQAKMFKTSWVDMGRMLYTIYKEKAYKDWGYEKFEHYAIKEIGIRKQTSLKLLRSYFFLEKDEPHYLKKDFIQEKSAHQVPDYETIDVLRQAKNKKDLAPEDYSQLKKKVFETGDDAKNVKKELTELIKQRDYRDPEELKEQRRQAGIKRLISLLKTLKEEMSVNNMLPQDTVKNVESLIEQLEERV